MKTQFDPNKPEDVEEMKRYALALIDQNVKMIADEAKQRVIDIKKIIDDYFKAKELFGEFFKGRKDEDV